MLNKKRISLLVATTMTVSILLTGCGSSEQTDTGEVETEASVETESEETKDTEVADQEETESEEKDDDEIVKLSDWNGTWNNLVAYLDDEELEESFTELAEREDVSVEEAKKEYVEDREVNFDGLIIDGDKIILLTDFKDNDGEEIEEIEYEYNDTIVVKHGNMDTEWFSFTSEDDGEYANLVMMPVHGEEALTHFHLRYGDDLDEILAMEDWYPTFVKPDSTYDQLHEEVVE